jgi:PKD repeat protein
MIPTASNFPEEFDDDVNLFLVHDALRLRLAEDYNPGDTVIKVEGDILVTGIMPSNGIITLTEQCSDIDKRAISFHYDTFDEDLMQFSGLDILEEFEDVTKPKRITNVTVNVMARHHNHIKDALIAIQEFCGVKGTIDTEPFGPTLEGRINFLRKLVLVPQAWFTSDVRTGNIPLEVEFRDMSFRLGTDGNAGEVRLTWDFGDQTLSTISFSTISVSDVVPDDAINVLVRDIDGDKVKKTYHRPGLYDVKLTVENDFGSDEVIFPEFINARVKAPEEAIIRFEEDSATQLASAGVPPNGPFSAFPKIRSPINKLIHILIEPGENPSIPGYSYAGEALDELGNPIDPIETYTWSMGDDFTHPSAPETKAAYSVGGIYDLKLRVDTVYGAYRITTYEDSIDIIENTNLWLWIIDDSNNARSYEFGLISETFKLTPATSISVTRDDSFLTGLPDEAKQKHEFKRNTGMAKRGNATSGTGAPTMLYWASGRGPSDLPTSEEVRSKEYVGFSDTYITRSSFQRQWNWVNLNGPNNSYFIFGGLPSYSPNTSYTNTQKDNVELTGLTVTSNILTADDYFNGAGELEQNVAIYDNQGEPLNGHYSVYRSAWKDDTGYFARNDGVGAFFRIKSFYRTEGSISSPFNHIRKLQDIQGPTKLEGELTNLSDGVFFLSNSGSVSKFDDVDQTWTTGGPGANSLLYRNLQDTSVSGFDNPENTLLLTSDNDKRAYMSFDYSPNAFLKFNEIDLTFSSISSRPDGEQWIMGAF